MQDRITYPVGDAAHKLGIGKTKLFELIRTGDVDTIKIGTRTLVPHQSLVAFVERLQKAA